MTSRRRRSLGQHFLNSQRIARRIVDFADIKDDIVIEIGAGKGKLTKILAEKAHRLYATEIDRRLIAKLQQLLAPNITILPVDFLSLDLSGYDCPVVVGNIPYSLTHMIIDHLITHRAAINRAVLTVQKEYGERLCALPGSSAYGPITLEVNYYFTVTKGFTIPARFFSPAPKVSSTVIAFRKKKPLFTVDDDKAFFDLIKKVFQHRRKTLRNCLTTLIATDMSGVRRSLLEKRPSDLCLEDFHHVYCLLTKA